MASDSAAGSSALRYPDIRRLLDISELPFGFFETNKTDAAHTGHMPRSLYLSR
jgi:hypothetical protein